MPEDGSTLSCARPGRSGPSIVILAPVNILQPRSAQRNDALASAEIMLVGWPPVKDIRARAPRLKWVHELPAGASNFLDTDLWGSDVIVTTSRGLTNRRPMAEYVLASFLHFSRGLHLSYRDQRRHQLDHHTYDPIIIRDKTVCVVGAGGIGQEVAKLCAAAGMRVVGTRREVASAATLPPGFARLEPAGALHELLRESEFVAICCPWTTETTHLIGREAFAAMKPGTVLVNIARGEIIDEEALIVASESGQSCAALPPTSTTVNSSARLILAYGTMNASSSRRMFPR